MLRDHMNLMRSVTSEGHLMESFWANFAHICFLVFAWSSVLVSRFDISTSF